MRCFGERWYQAELYRLKGDLLNHDNDLDDRDDAEIAPYYAQSMNVAQNAKLWELLAAMSLARRQRDQGKAH
jgi:hypothetical protein